MLSYFHRFSVFVWTGENDSNTLSADACFFFKKRRKKSQFSKISGYVWTSLIVRCLKGDCRPLSGIQFL